MHRFRITGVVQGVGFRPFIKNACEKAGLRGYVRNTGNGVTIVVDDRKALERILEHLPPRARIDGVEVEECEEERTGFSIEESVGEGFAQIPPDGFMCPSCERDLLDPKDRRHGYYFMTCTACGPRYSIALESPFDRRTTTMAKFPMCDACAREYGDPSDRRFHAQTIACPDCGPRLRLHVDGKSVEAMSEREAIERAARLLERGEIVAIKGVGGFHLAVAMTKDGVARLDRVSGRSRKPYAIMCRTIEDVRRIAQVDDAEAETLLSDARPIVLLKKKVDDLSASELDTIGVMLPYSALQVLLLEAYGGPLVLTSSNRSDEPITVDRAQQFVPHVLDHDRAIAGPVDDSVVKTISGRPLFIRRSRGFVPESIKIDSERTMPILALGAEMNATFALYDGAGSVIVSPHLGNTANPAAFERYARTLDRFLSYTRIVPKLIVRDLHPTYSTSQHADVLAKRFGASIAMVQHHRAHAAGVALEHGVTDATAIVCDGMGYGEDGEVWGGEVFDEGERIGHLEAHRLLGGDSATRYPHKMLFSILRSFLPFADAARTCGGRFTRDDYAILDKQREAGFNAPLTTSAGRVLDAAAALLGLCDERTYDGRPAMLLESASTTPLSLEPIIEDGILKTGPLFRFLLDHRNEDVGRLAATVERYLAEGLFEIASSRKKPIVWAGGCAYNRTMTSYLLERGVLVNERIPPGDGGISFGQIAWALADARNDIA